VSVTPTSAGAGAVVDLTTHVDDDAASPVVRVEVAFPVEHPALAATPEPLAGWTASVDARTGGARSVTWDGGSLAPGGAIDFVATVTLPRDIESLPVAVVLVRADGSTEERSGATGELPVAATIALTGASTTSTTAARATTSTTSPAPSSGGAVWSTGDVLIAIGIALTIVVVVRSRRNARRR